MNGGTGKTQLLQGGLELRSRLVLEEGVGRIDARTRSRLNQARQAAVAAALGSRRPLWLMWSLKPATGAVAVAMLVMVLMLSGRPQTVASAADTPASTLDVLDLITDDDALGLMEDGDNSFYEWAAAQTDAASAQSAGDGTST